MSDIERIIKISGAIREILEIFAEQEIGMNVEVDEDALAEYMDSNKCIAEYFSAITKEQMYEVFLNQILNGYPVWELLKLSQWTKNMLEKEFKQRVMKEKKKIEDTYICLKCKHYTYNDVSLGRLHRCHGSTMRKKKGSWLSERFELQMECDEFESK